MRRTVIATLAVGVGLAVAWAMAAENPSSYARDVEPIFVKECTDCHGVKHPKKGLVLEKGEGYGHMVGVKSQEMPAMDLVKPGDPAGSYLWLKLAHTATQGKGMPRSMLFGSRKLPQEQLDVVQRWIRDGALP
jgi:hypothetical protein